MPPRKHPPQGLAYGAPKPTVDELLESKKRLNRVTADFLKIDLQTALTFVAIAQESPHSWKRTRNRRSARKAYDTILRLMPKVSLSEGDAETLGQNLRRLKSQLVSLGEVF